MRTISVDSIRATCFVSAVFLDFHFVTLSGVYVATSKNKDRKVSGCTSSRSSIISGCESSSKPL